MYKNRELYRGRYIIAFYEKDDETIFNVFSNIYEILDYLGREHTRYNYQLIKNYLSKALISNSHEMRLFEHRYMKVYIIDNEKEKDDDDDKLISMMDVDNINELLLQRRNNDEKIRNNSI